MSRDLGPSRANEAMSSLTDALDHFARHGFTEHFGVRGDQLLGFDSGVAFGAEQVVVRRFDRFEGVSDPDDMSIVYAIEAPDGVRGTLTDAFGVYASPTVGAFMSRVALDPSSPTHVPSAPHR